MVSKEGKCCDNDGLQLDHCTHTDKSAISTAISVFEIFPIHPGNWKHRQVKGV